VTQPIISLLDYQRRWVEDQSRFKAALWSRSAGKTFALTLEPAIDVQLAEAEGRRCEWAFFSASEEQTKEMVLYAERHCKAIDLGATQYEEEHETLDERTGEKRKVSMLALRFPHGSRIIGLPTNPFSIRGKHMNLLGDEAGHWPNADALWQAAGGIALRSGFKVRLSGTAGAKKGPFYEICEGLRPGWNVHKIDIHQAIAAGAPITLDEAHRIAGFGRAFAVEFELLWEDEGARWLEIDDITACERGNGVLLVPELVIDAERAESWKPLLDAQSTEFPYDKPEAWRRLFAPLVGLPDLYLGYDVARRRHFAVLTVLQVEGQLRLARAVIALKGQRFGLQKGCLWAAFEHVRRGCIDTGGMGMQLGEEAGERFGTTKAEAVEFSTSVKEDLAVRMKRRTEDRALVIPRSPLLRASLHSVYKQTTAAGNVRFDADATEEAGHADHFWSMALADMAAGDGTQKTPFLASAGARTWSRAGAFA
jgi:phage FluMu gp28-like protein